MPEKLETIRKPFLEELEKIGKEEETLAEERKKVEKEIVPRREEYEKALSEYKEHLKTPLPKYPVLEEIPKAPEKPNLDNIWQGISTIGRLAINLSLLLVALKAGGRNYLIAFNRFADAVRKRKLEDFEIARQEYKDKLEEIRERNNRLISEFNANVELAKLGEQKAIDLVNANLYNYQLAIGLNDNINKQMAELEKIRRDYIKVYYQEEMRSIREETKAATSLAKEKAKAAREASKELGKQARWHIDKLLKIGEDYIRAAEKETDSEKAQEYIRKGEEIINNVYNAIEKSPRKSPAAPKTPAVQKKGKIGIGKIEY
jgi:hypothetical protein